MNDMKLQLAQEDARDLGRGARPSHDMPPSTFLLVGLELEEQQ